MVKYILLALLIVCFIQTNVICKISYEGVRHYRNAKLHSKDDVLYLTVPGDHSQFFIIGDWGGLPVYPYRTIIEEAVAVQMAKLAQFYDTQFQLAVGDNFYFDGVANVSDKRFQETFENVFDSQFLYSPWFVLMGNHDHYGNASAQIEYTGHSKRWVLPDYNYTINVQINGGAQDLIHILMLDTVLLCGNSGYDWSFEQPQFDSKYQAIFANYYFDWIEEHLKAISNTSVPYIIVAGHFPVWSISSHGPTQCLVNKLRPLLHKYQVSAYFCGHDHNLQHLTDTFMNVTVEHVLSGASNLNDNSTTHINDVPNDSLKFFWGLPNVEVMHGGVSVVQANPDNMTITFLETTGKELYHTVVYPRNKQQRN